MLWQSSTAPNFERFFVQARCEPRRRMSCTCLWEMHAMGVSISITDNSYSARPDSFGATTREAWQQKTPCKASWAYADDSNEELWLGRRQRSVLLISARVHYAKENRDDQAIIDVGCSSSELFTRSWSHNISRIIWIVISRILSAFSSDSVTTPKNYVCDPLVTFFQMGWANFSIKNRMLSE